MTSPRDTSAELPVICFSHLRWDFVFQRPNHLMSRCARSRQVFFVEEPRLHLGAAELEVSRTAHGPHRVVPKLPSGTGPAEVELHLKQMVDLLLESQGLSRYLLWYYTPMALPFTRHLSPELVVYDVMDELKNFQGAPPRLLELEEELFERADVVFTGGESLYQAKKHLHPDEALMEQELTDGLRVLHATQEAAAFVSACARHPYEVWVAPARAVPSLALLEPHERAALARALKVTLQKYDGLWRRPFPYVLAVHQAPTDGREYLYAHLHFELYPAYRQQGRLKYLAGSELGAGFFTADALPEEKAKELQAVEVPPS